MTHEDATVVLVHGFTQSGASLSGIAAGLRSRGLTVRTPDLSGHGTAPAPTGDLASEGRRLGEEEGRGVYVGYSLGGRVCLHLALARPDLVDALVLASSTAGIDGDAERAARRRADGALADRIGSGGDAGVAGFIDEWLLGPLFAGLDAATANRAARLVNTASGLAGSLRHHGAGTQEPLWDRLGTLAMPVLVVAGSTDEKFSELGRRLVDGIGENARFVALEGGHAAPFEQPERFAELVYSFVTDRH